MAREGPILSKRGMVASYDLDEPPRPAMVDIEIPRECSACGFRNFYVWGTKMNGIINIVVRCMRCGK